MKNHAWHLLWIVPVCAATLIGAWILGAGVAFVFGRWCAKLLGWY